MLNITYIRHDHQFHIIRQVGPFQPQQNEGKFAKIGSTTLGPLFWVVDPWSQIKVTQVYCSNFFPRTSMSCGPTGRGVLSAPCLTSKDTEGNREICVGASTAPTNPSPRGGTHECSDGTFRSTEGGQPAWETHCKSVV